MSLSILVDADIHIPDPSAENGSGDAIGLIEINTNAGGAVLNAAMARARTRCLQTSAI